MNATVSTNENSQNYLKNKKTSLQKEKTNSQRIN